MLRKFLCLSIAVITVCLSTPASSQDPIRMEPEIRLRWEHRTPFPADDVTRGFSRTRMSFFTEFNDLIQFQMTVRDSRFLLSGADESEVTDTPQMQVLSFEIDDVSRIHSHLDFMAGWNLKFGAMDLPTYNKGRIIHADEWSNLGPTTSGGYRLQRSLLDDALDINFHHLTISRDQTDANNVGEYALGLHVAMNELPFVEASAFLWKYRADQSNADSASANGNADPGSTKEDTYGMALNLREGLIENLSLSLEYALQDGDRYSSDFDAVQRLDSLYYAIEGEYDLPPQEGIWDLDLVVGHIRATGTSSGATRNEAFLSPFGTPHGTHGIADIIDNSNVKNTYFGVRTRAFDTDWQITYHELRADQGEDWGDELDIVAEHTWGDLEVEYGAAKFISTNGALETTTFFYAQSYWNF